MKNRCDCKLKCDCEERTGTTINSIENFQELKDFFNKQVKNGVFVEEVSTKPFYIWEEENNVKNGTDAENVIVYGNWIIVNKVDTKN